MRYIILLLLLAVTLSAQTVELSALNYGGDWQTNDAAYIAEIKRILDNHCKSDTLAPFLYHYVYSTNDSAISFIDSADSVKVIERYFNYRSGQVAECPVVLKWVTISKASPAKESTREYSGWKGGPWSKNVPALSTKDTRGLKLGLEYRDAVDKAQKADLKLKRKDAWAKVKAEKKAEKEKNEPRPVIDSGYGVFRHSCGGAY